MYKGKLAYIEKLTPRFAPVRFGKEIDGSSPPGIFIGRFGYPNVFVGPLVTPQKGDTTLLDTPEAWLGTAHSAMDIATFRMSLCRGMQRVGITDLGARMVGQMRDIALSRDSLATQAAFKREPRGYAFNDDHQPFGPSAPLASLELDNARYEHHMEKAHYDTDLKANEAMINLYDKGLLISHVQKAFSVGAFGRSRSRRLVPTRWSITAVDDILGKHLLEEVKHYPVLDRYLVFEHTVLNNRFVILLMPEQWRYEFLEAFIHVLGNEELLFSDHESYGGRKNYAQIGGCYYSTRLALAEKLQALQKQAGAIVFRESYPGYVPLGVWLVRETARTALRATPHEFTDKESALMHIAQRLAIRFWKYKKESALLAERNLLSFLKH